MGRIATRTTTLTQDFTLPNSTLLAMLSFVLYFVVLLFLREGRGGEGRGGEGVGGSLCDYFHTKVAPPQNYNFTN